MGNVPQFYPVYRSVNKPLTILGAERRLFFLACVMAGATFNFFGGLSPAALMYVVLYAVARWVTTTDPEILRILFNSSRFKVRYDPGRFEPARVVRIL
jgi:type IV secretory pathway TrbD component